MRILVAAALLCPTVLMAKDDDSPPSKPAVTCEGAKVYDKTSKSCVDPQESSLDREQLYQTVRYLAYAGRYDDAQKIMKAMPPLDPGRLTYMGFTHRKLGNLDLAMAFYQEAIDRDPENIAARSYMGQGLVDAGQIDAAMVQLRAIRDAGGRGSWSEISLKRAIASGKTYSY